MPSAFRPLRILSYNINKGASGVRKRNVLSAIREAVSLLDADIVFLQEVRVRTYGGTEPGSFEAQFDFLASGLWPHIVYGRNVMRDMSHHGNAILSRYPIASWENIDVSAHPVEGRGILHAVVELPSHRHAGTRSVHMLCLHLGLLERWRRKQMTKLEARIRSAVPEEAPLLVAGDFNDWRERATEHLANGLHLDEAFHDVHGAHARTFPSRLPTLKLDRIYMRGFLAVKAERLSGKPWSTLSDHVPLLLEVV